MVPECKHCAAQFGRQPCTLTRKVLQYLEKWFCEKMCLPFVRFASQMAGVEVQKGNALERGLEAFGCPERKGAESASVLFFYRSVVAWECLELIEKDFQGSALIGNTVNSFLLLPV